MIFPFNFPLVDVAKWIATSLVDLTKNEIYEHEKERRKLKKLIQKDLKKFEIIFAQNVSGNELNLISDFLFLKAIKTNRWYSYDGNLSNDQKDLLWTEFENYMKLETGAFLYPTNVKDFLTKCIEYHNKQINEVILSHSDHIFLNTAQKQYSDIKKSIENISEILTTETEMSQQYIDIDFVLRQINGLLTFLNSRLAEIRRQRFILSIAYSIILAFIIIVIACCIIISSQKTESVLTNVITLLSATIPFFLVLLHHYSQINKEEKEIQDKISKYVDDLWKINFQSYKNVFNGYFGKQDE